MWAVFLDQTEEDLELTMFDGQVKNSATGQGFLGLEIGAEVDQETDQVHVASGGSDVQAALACNQKNKESRGQIFVSL